MKSLTTLSIAIFLFCSCSKQSRLDKKPVYVQYFKLGEVLLPDYAITDTLIVIDAIGLNKAVGLFEQGIIEGTDRNIVDVFYKFCIVK